MWLSTITLKIFSKFALFSYFPSDVDQDIDGSFKVNPMSGWIISLHLLSKLDNACTFRCYQHGPWIPLFLQPFCVWLKFVIGHFRFCLICLMIVAVIEFSKDRIPSELFQISAKEWKCTLILIVYWLMNLSPRELHFCQRSFDISWPLYKNPSLPWIHTDGNVNIKGSVLD